MAATVLPAAPPALVEGQPCTKKAGTQPDIDTEAMDRLEAVLAAPAFLAVLEEAKRHPLEHAAEPSQASCSNDDADSLFSDSPWEHAVLPEEVPGGPQGGQPPEFIVVERQDAVEAMAFYIAQCLVKHPEAQAMSPAQLQLALNTAFKALKQSKFKRLCSVGRSVYRWTTLTYSAVQMWQNPWIVRLVLTAIWTFSRMSIRALLP